MHIVTKILIVFVAILGIMLSALTIAFTANADSIRDSVKAERDARTAAQAELGLANANASKERSTLQSEKERAEAQIVDITKEISKLQAERADLLSRVKEAELAAENVKNQISGLGETAKTNAQLIKVLTDETSSLRQAQLASAKREADLIDRLNDIESQKQVLEQTTRALQEQLAEAKFALETAKSGTDATKARGGAVESLGPRIVARVVRLDKFPNGDDMAEINVGSAAGVRENQKLNIVRGTTFLGSLIITKVDVQTAVGKIDRMGLTTAPATDDLVISRLD